MVDLTTLTATGAAAAAEVEEAEADADEDDDEEGEDVLRPVALMLRMLFPDLTSSCCRCDEEVPKLGCEKTVTLAAGGGFFRRSGDCRPFASTNQRQRNERTKREQERVKIITFQRYYGTCGEGMLQTLNKSTVIETSK